ncbi:FAD-dependent monooxygenase [Chelatococcus sp. SYSU_G07232]|uniref:FAD-dependent monooxygenase n=1 Tax=Chelatococcus albus TaxID=3047466 RepID=A0ABT7AJ46_9HYPH|nr:FAD-dependent monooxygenase [Chelatococcus sp. SYSU_G07232]MDJ1159405.1 FAD-dependent monooxygenase [Chelatococcus sp. SYSU_G07232]
MMLGTEPAVVAGAGIGGLTAALSLARRGVAVTVLERRTALEEAGAGIQLSPNASRVLIDLGLGPALARQAVEPDRVVIRAVGSGRTIGGIALGRHMRERYGAPYWVIHRADLHTILLDAARSLPNLRLLVGRRVESLREENGQALVGIATASNGQDVLPASLVVGADGVWSAVRPALGDGRAPQYRGYAAWRTTIARAAAPAAFRDANETGLWLGPEAHVVHYPVSGGRKLNIVAVLRGDKPLDGWASPGERDQLLHRFRKAAEPLRGLLATAPEWLVWSLYDLPASRRWSRGRATLLGDAAHPVLPFLAQGGALAIEDASVLARELAARPGDVPAALALYEAARRPRAQRVQEGARSNARAYHLAWPLSMARDAVIRRLGPEGMVARYDWLYGWRPE